MLGCASGKGTAETNAPSGWPVSKGDAIISSGFGAPRGSSSHKGIDLAADRGTQVVATGDGRVTFAGTSGDYGRMVVIDHGGGWETRYAHLRRIKVKHGARVKRGKVIGSVGHSGNASGNHVHYEIRHHGIAVDPRPTLDR
jgi:murein DD-endopeptidase MepM/ murein hydrolase activator NlpD